VLGRTVEGEADVNTITAKTAAQWIDWLTQIQAAAQAVEDRDPPVPTSLWRQVHDAKAFAVAMRRELLAAAVGGVAVEVQNEVKEAA
jgi:hypothetical protein